MKKLINYSLLLTFAVLTFSCSKDKDNASEPSLNGKWHLSFYGQKGTGTDITWASADDASMPCAVQNYFEFKADGTFVQQNYDANATTGACEAIAAEPGHTSTWTKVGDVLTVTDTDNTTTPPNVVINKLKLLSLTDTESIFQGYTLGTDVLADMYVKFSRR